MPVSGTVLELVLGIRGSESRVLKHKPKDIEEENMNWDQVTGNWKQVKGKAKQMWGDFTDDELDVMEGKSEELVGRLQTKYGYSKEKAQEEADRWVKSL